MFRSRQVLYFLIDLSSRTTKQITETIMDLEEDDATSFITTRARPHRSLPAFSPDPEDEIDIDTASKVDIEADVHERPTTMMMSPEPKRSKKEEASVSPVPAPLVLAYPLSVPVPSSKTIRTLYKAALVEAESSPVSHSTPSGNSINNMKNDQMYLKLAGVLSMEQVLLPALGLEEERAIKRVQAKVQRDAPEYKFVMENCRRLVRQSVANAIAAVAANREKRVQQQVERRKMKSLEMQQARESRKLEMIEEHKRKVQEQKRLREIAKMEKKNKIKQQLPKNQTLWKEVVYLTSSISQLEKEGRLWVQAEKDLKILEGKSDMDGNDKENATPVVFTAKKHYLHKEAERKAKDIVMASDRIQRGLGMVLQLLKESEQVRNELYNKYRNEHLFQGYQSIDDPKGMIRFLSQNSHDDTLY
jgi:hypothetical protein